MNEEPCKEREANEIADGERRERDLRSARGDAATGRSFIYVHAKSEFEFRAPIRPITLRMQNLKFQCMFIYDCAASDEIDVSLM